MTDIAWHFAGPTLSDGRPIPPIGETLVHDGEVKLCKAGYHWSRTPWDALRYAPGPLLHKVRIGGKVIEGSDKGVSSERTILASIDATYLLRRFAADEALSVAHLWPISLSKSWLGMPDIVREYLTTLDEGKREEAFRLASEAASFYSSRAARIAACAAYRGAADAAWGAGADADEFNRRVHAEFERIGS